MRERVFVSWQPPDAPSYAYLLGVYLGDGCVAPHGRTARLVLADIRGLVRECCDRLGVRWTQSNARNLSVSHRRSAAHLDAFIGPKR